MKRRPESDRLEGALLETAADMRRVGVMDAPTHEKITLRHLGSKAGAVSGRLSATEECSEKAGHG